MLQRLRRAEVAPTSSEFSNPQGACLRPEFPHFLRQLVRRELTLLQRLGRDRRDASTRLPILRRTGPDVTAPTLTPPPEPSAKRTFS
jgi:hypothetical protein